MSVVNLELDYLEEYNAFGIADERLKSCTDQGQLPILSLKAEDEARLSVKKQTADRPTIGFLLGRDQNFYTIGFDYAKSVAQSGAHLRLLTYEDNVAQLIGVDGLLLPGGCFTSPDQFYTDPKKQTDEQPQARSYAYLSSIIRAEKVGMPILGICAGSQMVGGFHGLKMYRNIKDYVPTDIEHKTKALKAHKVRILKESPLFELIGQSELDVNSRHSEAVVPFDATSDLNIYAYAPDGIPEAWGNAKKGILCIQWHPEEFAARGDEKMQNIYNWLAQKATVYHTKKHKNVGAKC